MTNNPMKIPPSTTENLDLAKCRIDVSDLGAFKNTVGMSDIEIDCSIANLYGVKVYKNNLVPEKEAWLIDTVTGKLIRKYNL